jgi:thiamine transport system permease protein
MSSSKFQKPALFAFFLLFLLFPYLFLVSKFGLVKSIDTAELWWALQNSFWQALWSSLGSLLFGFWLCLGFFLLQKKLNSWQRQIFEVLLILPSLLPPLFVLLITMNFIDPFPVGMLSVVLIHVLVNAGLVALLLKNLVDAKMRPLIEAAYVEGASRWLLLKSLVGMAKRDLMSILLFVFVLCFSSFSVPMVVGGGESTTLEILIYEKIRISGDWGQALSLSFIQLAVILLLSYLPFESRRKLFGRSEDLPLFRSRTGALALISYCCAPIIYFAVQAVIGWEQVQRIPGLWELAVEVLPLSLMFALGVGFLTAFLLLVSAWGAPSPLVGRLIRGVISPSTALLGFSLLFFFSNEEPWSKIKWTVGFTYLIFSTLYRWGWDQELSGLNDQIQVAETMGASRGLIFREIILPQMLKPLGQAAGIASLWALGDFALGKILLGRSVSLSLLIESLMSSYRLQSALSLTGVLICLGALCFLFFWGLAYVCRRALEQKI